ncbi:MAG: ferrous iron transporter B [Hungatella sp.]|nr:ferrous iron transporter B [Hungatella sp.]
MDNYHMVVALAGNPNVGKSTIFNGITGLKQHTANWPGVTVESASGEFSLDGKTCILVDLPGTYSLNTHSKEEEVTRQYLASGEADTVVVVCDATCMERGLHLLKQILSLDPIKDLGIPLVLCINLCDEARKKGIEIDFELLKDVLQIPVVSCCARCAGDLVQLKEAILSCCGKAGRYDCLDFSPKRLAAETVRYTRTDYRKREETIDRIVTGRFTGTLIMVLLLLGVFWLTMAGANYPSGLLWNILFSIEGKLDALLTFLNVPDLLIQALVYGVYRVLAWVVSVMLPPMAIFFPLFTLLEDLGYLPRIAFHMDRSFKRCRACGKQCLTMAMGFGCNAAGVIGCRIIDSPRERLIAILTNSLVPCNGRFPTLFTLITLFFLTGIQGTFTGSLAAALLLTAAILAGVCATLGCSWVLSHTLLKGLPSAFTLELPPYRRPQIGKVLIRSILDRTLFVLGRAAAIAAPAGLIIWLLANTAVGGQSLLLHLTGFFDPLGRLMGLDGVILMAFLLGFPANEIVIPIMLMAYLQSGMLVEMTDSAALFTLLTANGWTWKTALCMLIFCLFHWPCSTTCLTVKKETGSLKWTAAAILLPTILGVVLCTAVHAALFVFPF